MPPTMSVRETARLLGVGLSTVYDMIARGELDVFRTGNGRNARIRVLTAPLARKLGLATLPGSGDPTADAQAHVQDVAYQQALGEFAATAVPPPRRRPPARHGVTTVTGRIVRLDVRAAEDLQPFAVFALDVGGHGKVAILVGAELYGEAGWRLHPGRRIEVTGSVTEHGVEARAVEAV